MESLTELKCNILLVCETWLTTAKNDVTASISDFGYNIHHVIRKNSSKIREGGVGILYPTNIKPVRLNCGSYSSFEHCALYICCPKTAKRFNFIVLYRLLDIPVNQFLSDLACLLETAVSFPGVMVVGGDVNFHINH